MNFSDSLMIIDEGHNVEQVCEDAMSFEFTVEDFQTCLEEVKQLEKAYEDSKMGVEFPG